MRIPWEMKVSKIFCSCRPDLLLQCTDALTVHCHKAAKLAMHFAYSSSLEKKNSMLE